MKFADDNDDDDDYSYIKSSIRSSRSSTTSGMGDVVSIQSWMTLPC